MSGKRTPELGEYARFASRPARGRLGSGRVQDCAPLPRGRERYLRVSIAWVRWASAAARGKSVLQAALVLAHVCGLTKSPRVEVKGKLLAEFGFTRQGYYRGLCALEAAGVVKIERKPGKRLAVNLLPRPRGERGKFDSREAEDRS